MPTFTETERDHIREQLLESGREMFSRYGLKKTSLEDLTRPAGIAKSSFYGFFDSKEALYMEILMSMRQEVKDRILGASFEADNDAREAIVRFLRVVVHELETNPLTRRLVTHPEELQMLSRKVSPEQMEANIEASTLPILSFIREAQARGEVIAGDPEVISGVIRSVTMLTLHKEDIGSTYQEVIEMMIGLVADGLTVERDGR
ncbi:MAG: TetR/AcrR family transcriptional regulator [Rubrobacteraceae bacterium]